MSDPIRSRQARELAERALVRFVHAYGELPKLVLLRGLVPDLLCSAAARQHVGTTDVDVQVDLEIRGGSVNASRPEYALQHAGPPEGTWMGACEQECPAASPARHTKTLPVGLHCLGSSMRHVDPPRPSAAPLFVTISPARHRQQARQWVCLGGPVRTRCSAL